MFLNLKYVYGFLQEFQKKLRSHEQFSSSTKMCRTTLND